MKLTFVVEIKPYAREHREAVWKLLTNHSDGRLTPESVDQLSPQYPRGELRPEVIAFVAVLNDKEVIGYSAIDDERSITVVHPGLRCLGIGRAMLREKLVAYFQTHPEKEHYDTLVGTSNVGSVRMCLALGGYLVDANYHPNGKPWLKFRFDRDKIFEFAVEPVITGFAGGGING